MKYEINISGFPAAYLDNLGRFSKLALIEQSSKAGNIARKSIRKEFRNETTEWSKEYKDGKLKFFKKTSKLGIRMNHQKNQGSISDPANMESMITSFTHQTTGTTVIMGGHKSHHPILIQNGEIKGYGPRQSSIARRTLAILEKLNSGKRDSVYWENMKRKGFNTGQFRGNQKYHQRNWAERGWNTAYSQVKSEMTEKLHNLIVNFENKKGKTA
jgi:hypothetical protein